MSYVDRLEPKDVNSPRKLAEYCSQLTGIPYPAGKEIGLLTKVINDTFEKYPYITYESLCNVVQWAKVRKKRYSSAYTLIRNGLEKARDDGFVPETDIHNDPGHIDNLIADALRMEGRKEWRTFLMNSITREAKLEAYRVWNENHPADSM